MSKLQRYSYSINFLLRNLLIVKGKKMKVFSVLGGAKTAFFASSTHLKLLTLKALRLFRRGAAP
jgi:hypothetical protein